MGQTATVVAERIGKVFPNLARGFDSKPEDFPEVNKTIRKELEEAGCIVHDLKSRVGGEVPATIHLGEACRWSFERAWYYYRAKGPGIPPDVATYFDLLWGRDVRAEGDCACRGAEFWGQGFAIESYHIDTQEGLNAFVKMLKTIHKPRLKEKSNGSETKG